VQNIKTNKLVSIDSIMFELFKEAASNLPVTVYERSENTYVYASRKYSVGDYNTLAVAYSHEGLIVLYTGSNYADRCGDLYIKCPNTPKKLREHLEKYCERNNE
jgi:hypothetical protein